jgi:hypothetical protein
MSFLTKQCCPIGQKKIEVTQQTEADRFLNNLLQ